jgi:CRP-like cAMP-binding protein
LNSISHVASRFLASLPPAVFELLRPNLRLVDMKHESVLARAGEALSRVWFPHSGIISLVVNLSEGEMVEVAMIGRDSVFGAAAIHDGGHSPNDAIVQAPGVASVIDLAHFCYAVAQSPPLRDALARHDQILLLQAQQSAACNAFHTVECRLSRWLLRAHDLYDSNTLPLTQGFLAQMIGVRRNSVSLVANTLQQAGLVRYRRGHIEITNLEGLKETSCECYETVKIRSDRLLASEFRRELGRGPACIEPLKWH